MAIYKWKPRTCFKADPEKAAELFNDIEDKNGYLDKKLVVKAAKPVKSPIHDDFEWDDKEAADKYRLEQAGQMIRSIVVYEEEDPEEQEKEVPVRVYHVVKDDLRADEKDKHATYLSVKNIMDEPEYRVQVLDEATADFTAFVNKYNRLLDFFGLSVTAGKLLKKFVNTAKKAKKELAIE